MGTKESPLGIEVRLDRLESAEAIRGVFARYTFCLDGGRLDELMEIFTDDAQLIDHSGNGGETAKRDGRSDLRRHFEALPFGWFRHHTTNMTIDVSGDARTAEMSSYFLTTYPHGMQGGVYEVTFRREAGGHWRIARLHVTSAWGWHAFEQEKWYFDKLAHRTLRGGRPVVWDATVPVE